jgi:hypothetical protein
LTRWARPLVLAALVLIFVQAAAAVFYHALSPDVPTPPNVFGPRGFMAALAVVLGSAGALIVLRRAGNAIGWICLGAGSVAAVNGLAEGYAFWALLERGQDSGLALWAAWICEWVWILFLGAIALVPALFPDGRWRSPRWRTLILIGCTGTVVSAIANGLMPRLTIFPGDNPIGLPVDAGIYLAVTAAFTWAFGLLLIVGERAVPLRASAIRAALSASSSSGWL